MRMMSGWMGNNILQCTHDASKTAQTQLYFEEEHPSMFKDDLDSIMHSHFSNQRTVLNLFQGFPKCLGQIP